MALPRDLDARPRPQKADLGVRCRPAIGIEHGYLDGLCRHQCHVKLHLTFIGMNSAGQDRGITIGFEPKHKAPSVNVAVNAEVVVGLQPELTVAELEPVLTDVAGLEGHVCGGRTG